MESGPWHCSQLSLSRLGFPSWWSCSPQRGAQAVPPADELLIRLDEEQFVPGALVIPLSEHVAYWNGTWRDPFSDPGFTERQRTYHPLLGSTALYTPEMVVDGQAQFVGSQRMLAEHAIARATTTPKAVVDVSVLSAFAQGALQVELAISDTSPLGDAAAVEIWIAVAENGPRDRRTSR